LTPNICGILASAELTNLKSVLNESEKVVKNVERNEKRDKGQSIAPEYQPKEVS
jgi:hypothetical protein